MLDELFITRMEGNEEIFYKVMTGEVSVGELDWLPSEGDLR